MTNENKDIDISLDNQDTQPDVLHGIAQSKMNKPAGEWSDSDDEHIGKIVNHPKVSPDTVSKIYNHAFPKPETVELPGQEAPENRVAMSHIFQSGKASLADTEDYINRTWKSGTGSYGGPATLDFATAHPALSDEFKQQKTNEYINDPDLEFNLPDFNHKPGYLHSLLLDRPLPQPEVGQMTEKQKQTNLKVSKIDKTVFQGLNTAKHTPEEYDQSVKLFTSNAPYGYKGEFKYAASQFIDSQKELSPKHLDTFTNAYGQDPDILESVIKHPNVDPALVSKVALHSEPGNDKNHWPNPRIDALGSPKLPENVRKQIIESYNRDNPDEENNKPTITHLLANDHLPAEDVEAIYKKTKDIRSASIAACSHPNASPSLVEDYYNSNKEKKAAFTNDILKVPHTPPNILRDIVATNKNAGAAIAAMSHKNADISVVETGLKRRMAAVQEAASLNPLVAHKILRDKLKNGNIAASDVLFHKETSKAFGEPTLEDITVINQNYKKPIKDNDYDADDHAKVKYWLATNEAVPEEIQKQNRQDIINDYMDNSQSAIGSEDEKPEGPHVNNQIIKLANDHGDIGVKAVILQRPWSVADKLDYSKDSYDTAFLDSIEPILKQTYDKRNATVPQNTPYETYLKPLLKNPNLSQELFDKITLSEGYQSKGEMMIDSYHHYRNDGHRTILDGRYADAEESVKYEGFKKISDLNNDYSRHAILNSSTAPDDLWNKAFSEYDPEKRKRFFNNDGSSFIHKLDEVNLNKTINGDHNYSINGKLNKEIQTKIISNLDSSNPAHVSAFNNYINRVWSNQVPSSESGHISPETLVSSVNSNYWKDPASDSTVKMAMSKNNHLGALLAFDKEYEGTPYDQKDKVAENLKQQFSFDNNPQAYYKRWDILANTSTKNVNDAGLHSIIDRGGNLDFLANVPGDAEQDFELRNRALKQGYLSKDAINQVLAQDPAAFGKALGGMADKQVSATTQSVLNNASIHPDAMKGILDNLDHRMIIPTKRINAYGGREAMSDEDWQSTMGFADKIVDHTLPLVQAGMHPNVAANIANKLTRNEDRKDKLTIPQKKELISRITDKIINSTVISPEKKSDIISTMADSFDDPDYVPAKLKDAVSNLAIAGGDLETLIALDDDGKGTRAITTEINKAMKNAKNLNSRQLYAVSNLLRKGKTTTKNAVSIIDAVSNKLGSGNPEDLDVVSDTVRSISGVMTWDDPVASEKAINHITTLSNSEVPHLKAVAQRNLLHYMGKMTDENQKKVFSNLPSEFVSSGQGIAEINEIDPVMAQLSLKNINDPDILLSATHGWKFKALIQSSLGATNGLESNTIDVLTNRYIDHPEFGEEQNGKLNFADYLSQGPTESHQNNAIKLFRSLGDRGGLDFIAQLETRIDLKPTESVGLAAVHAINYINSDYVQKQSQSAIVNTVNASDALFRLGQVAEVAGNTLKGRDSSKEVTSAQQNMVDSLDKSVDLMKKVHNSMLTKIHESPETLDHDHVLTHAAQVSGLTKTISKSAKLLNHSTMMGLLEATNYPADAIKSYLKINRNIDQKHRDNLSSELNSFHNETQVIMEKWIKSSDIGDDQWGEVFTAAPSLKYKLDKFKDLSLATFEAADFDSMINDNTFVESMAKTPWSFKKEEAGKILDKTIPAMLNIFNKSGLNAATADSISDYVNSSVKLYPDHFDTDKLNSLAENFNNNPMYKLSLYTSASQSGAGGPGTTMKAIDLSTKLNMPMLDIARNSKLNKDHVDKLLSDDIIGAGTKAHEFDTGRMAIVIANNKNIDADSVNMIFNLVKEKGPALESQDVDKIFNGLIQQPELSFDVFKSIHNHLSSKQKTVDEKNNVFIPGQKFNKSFLNPKFGGELLRSLPAKLPQVIEKLALVDSSEGKLPKTFEFSPAKNRLKEVMPTIPAEGIHWTDFKKANPKVSQWNEIKAVFMSKDDDTARPEDFVRAMDGYGGDFNITFSYWDGAQRHDEKGQNNPNLVVQLNTGEDMENELKRDPKLFSFFQTIQKAANNVGEHGGHQIGGHPTTPFCASWVRVDTTAGKKGWIIEEFQSDFAAQLSYQVDMIKTQHPDGLTLDGQHFHPDEMKTYAKKIEKIISGWHEASVKGLKTMAKMQNIESLYLHGEDVRAHLSGMDDREAGNPVWMKFMYDRHPRSNGWEETTYNDYPNKSNRFAEELKNDGRSNKCWKFEIK